MKKSKFLKQILVIIVIELILLIVNSGVTNAALQANQNTQYKKVDIPLNWINNIRNMERSGEAMGLSETQNNNSLLATSESNNIDVHMIKATEYGAIAILSASGYGNLYNAKAITTTTGNKTGVMLNTNYWELTAGFYNRPFSAINERYYDTYTTLQTSAKIGDALGSNTTNNQGCTGWHSASNAQWVTGSFPTFIRGNGGIFSFNQNVTAQCYCRGVVVCGVGF